ncbi:MAG: hypothetical protein Q9223_002545 [Gallowayella weberi]
MICIVPVTLQGLGWMVGQPPESRLAGPFAISQARDEVFLESKKFEDHQGQGRGLEPQISRSQDSRNHIVGCVYRLKEKKRTTKAYEDFVNQWEPDMNAEHPEMREALHQKEKLRFKRSYQYLAHFLRMKFPRACQNVTSMDVAITFLQARKEQHPLSMKWRERFNQGLDAEEFEAEHGLRAWRNFVNGAKEI